MDWTKGYSARFYASIVDRDSMRDLGTTRFDSPQSNDNRVEIVSGSIKRIKSDLCESATLTCSNYPFADEQIIRVWLDARQSGESYHTPLFTGIAASSKRSHEGTRVSDTLECYSILKMADDILLPRGWYAPIDIDGPMLVSNLLKESIKLPITIDIDPTISTTRKLSKTILAESGETYLTMAEVILNTIGWYIHIDGYGNIYLKPIPKEGHKTVFGAFDNDVIELSFDKEYDWYSTPNVLMATMEGMSAIARDDDPRSIFSTVSRKREVWYEDTNCYLNENETLAEYAKRALTELQKISKTANYTRRFNPDIYPMDIVRLNYTEQDLTGDFRVQSQTIELGYGATTSEEVTQL